HDARRRFRDARVDHASGRGGGQLLRAVRRRPAGDRPRTRAGRAQPDAGYRTQSGPRVRRGGEAGQGVDAHRPLDPAARARSRRQRTGAEQGARPGQDDQARPGRSGRGRLTGRRMRRLEHPLRRFRLAAILLGIVIVVGVAGYMLINGWSLLDSFYMVIITISTVGYTEVRPQGWPGRLFTSGLIVVGVGTMLYGFGVFAETLADNAFGRYRRERQLQRDLEALRDHFLICGYGRIGTQVVAEFEAHRVPYVVIDQTDEALGRIRAEGRLHIEG